MVKMTTLKEKAFAKETFAEFIFAILTLFAKICFAKIKLMLPVTKNYMVFQENVQKLDSKR